MRYLSGTFFLFFLLTVKGNDANIPNKQHANTSQILAVNNVHHNSVAYDMMQTGNGLAVVDGELKQYHKLTLTWDAGVDFIESDNTFTDYRFDVTFVSPTGKSYKVPGYFAADGDAGETSATSGSKWRCHFTALETGTWTYTASFRTGANIAISFDEAEGSVVAPIDGDFGTFSISETDKSGKDFRAKGKLEYVGEHFMRWTNGEYFMKMGSNSPENLFEYVGFDDSNSSRTFPDHIGDWSAGDPTWKGGQGQGIIGAMNYLSGKNINSQYFVFHRKGEQASPWSNPSNSYLTYDVSKMDQWQIVFDHMMTKGLMAHIVFSESTNQSFFEVDLPSGDPSFSDARKLYFREIVARFGYLNAVTWNLGEENGWDRTDRVGPVGSALSTQQRLDFAAYLDQLAYYDDFITVHNGHSSDARIFDNLQGDNSITGLSMQGVFTNVNRSKLSTQKYRNESAISGRKWVVYYDEAFTFDPIETDFRFYIFRQKALWATLTAGGAGIEHYAHITNDGTRDIFLDIEMEDLRYSDPIFSYMKNAYDFYRDNNIPFQDMYNQDGIVNTGWCHGDEYENYVIYVEPENLGVLTIDLLGDYEVKWFDPRNGGSLIDGTVTNLTSGDNLNVGVPPSDLDTDWVVYLRKTQAGPVGVTGIEVRPEQFNLAQGLSYTLNAIIVPANADEQNVTWSSSDPSIVSVNADGMINALQIGQATITATTVDGNFKDQSAITVTTDIGACTASGTILMERYDGIDGSRIEDLLSASIYPDSPSVVAELTAFEIPQRVADSYGVRVRGYLCAPETGNYTFWIAGDDHVQLNVSPDNRASNATRIAFHESFTDSREWNKITTQRSQEVQLQQGQVYYIEALMKEGAFGDHLAVGWRKPSDGPGNIPSEVIPGNVLSTSTEVAVSGVTLEPSEANIIVGETLQLDGRVFPSNASNTSIVWSSGDISVVTVDAQGLIQGVAAGSTNVRVTSVDGSFVAETTVTVSQSTIPVTGVEMIETEIAINVGELQQLTVEVQPVDATNRSVVWSSQDIAVVTVDAEGNIVGISGGVTTITAVTVDGNFLAEATVTVSDVQTPVTGLSLNRDDANILVGEQLQLMAQVLPSNATDPAVIWLSDDASIVTVDSEGNILGITAGTTQVSATTIDGGFTAQTSVTVSEPIMASGITLSPTATRIAVGENFQMEAEVQPAETAHQSIIWSSEDTSLVTVASDGIITGMAVGTTTISVTTIDGQFVAQATVEVFDSSLVSVTDITLDFDSLDVQVGESIDLNPTVLPEDASDNSVIWSSNDTSIVTVGPQGTITGMAIGTTTVVVTTTDGGYSATLSVTVMVEEVLMVYPNPAADYVTVSGVKELIFVSIFTSNGQLLNRVKIVPGATKIYVADLPGGIYFVGLDNGRKLPFLKF